jgi:hypothetical protein
MRASEYLRIEGKGCATASTGTDWEGGGRGSTKLLRFRWDGESTQTAHPSRIPRIKKRRVPVLKNGKLLYPKILPDRVCEHYQYSSEDDFGL